MLEIVAALGLISVGVLGIVQMHFHDMRQVRALQEDHLALRLVENEWAQLQAHPAFAEHAGESPFRHAHDPELLRGLETKLAWQTVDGNPRLAHIRMELRWSSTLGRTRQKHADFLLAVSVESLKNAENSSGRVSP